MLLFLIVILRNISILGGIKEMRAHFSLFLWGWKKTFSVTCKYWICNWNGNIFWILQIIFKSKLDPSQVRYEVWTCLPDFCTKLLKNYFAFSKAVLNCAGLGIHFITSLHFQALILELCKNSENQVYFFEFCHNLSSLPWFLASFEFLRINMLSSK